MKMHKSITQDRIIAAVERSMHSLDNPGLCVAVALMLRVLSLMLASMSASAAVSVPCMEPKSCCSWSHNQTRVSRAA
jgi:uncharacterized ion transporter superfamily protein YfcC